VFHQNEVEQSAYNFEHSDVEFLLTAFGAHEKQAQYLMEQQLALPAYEQVLKAAHSFNLLDARGAISVTERAAYIGRIRALARAVAQSYLASRARLGFPLAPRAWADEVTARLADSALNARPGDSALNARPGDSAPNARPADSAKKAA
ncbi:MAG TPA: glycine--tRNA ligase subunit alpha, partial [Rubrivivax sp.]|nr:glycine--tRNA ligase subunit alpha [Rubrivivax sp.]